MEGQKDNWKWRLCSMAIFSRVCILLLKEGVLNSLLTEVCSYVFKALKVPYIKTFVPEKMSITFNGN